MSHVQLLTHEPLGHQVLEVHALAVAEGHGAAAAHGDAVDGENYVIAAEVGRLGRRLRHAAHQHALVVGA